MYVALRSWLQENPVLAAGVWIQVALALFALVASAFDKRQILGLNPWVKPLKFDLSVLILLVTIAGFLSGLQRFGTARSWIGGSIAVSLTLENCLISMQALRGVRSHMNYTTPFDAKVFMSMGLMAVVATAAIAALLALVFLDLPSWPAAVTWGVRMGLLVFLLGCIEGVVMVSHGRHTVGAADGLQGVPLLDWSRRHGDLRIAHFFALHAVQVFPLIGYFLSRTTFETRLQVAGVFAGSILYTLAVWLLFRQAMAGRPLLG